jgi:ABC-type Fe3+/spermidine/putrescine transport system ATPase subunit
MVRPEDTRVDAESGLVRGIVRDVVFLGEIARYTVETERGRNFLANVGGARRRFAEGAQVWLSWDADRVWLLPEAGGAATVH